MGNICLVAIWLRRRRAILVWNVVRLACTMAKILCTIRKNLRSWQFSLDNHRHRCSICLCQPHPMADYTVWLESHQVVLWQRPWSIRLSLNTRMNWMFYWKNSNHFGPYNLSTVQMWPTEHRYPKQHEEYYLLLIYWKTMSFYIIFDSNQLSTYRWRHDRGHVCHGFDRFSWMQKSFPRVCVENQRPLSHQHTIACAF